MCHTKGSQKKHPDGVVFKIWGSTAFSEDFFLGGGYGPKSCIFVGGGRVGVAVVNFLSDLGGREKLSQYFPKWFEKPNFFLGNVEGLDKFANECILGRSPPFLYTAPRMSFVVSLNKKLRKTR